MRHSLPGIPAQDRAFSAEQVQPRPRTQPTRLKSDALLPPYLARQYRHSDGDLEVGSLLPRQLSLGL
eukprot:scaffold1373_cov367-Pinguiococcus_pyrenoidosus.AAC.21